MSTSTPLTIIAISTALAGQEAKLRAAQERLVAETVREPGCLRYELHQSPEDSRMLVFVESWESEQTWRAHKEGAARCRFDQRGGITG